MRGKPVSPDLGVFSLGTVDLLSANSTAIPTGSLFAPLARSRSVTLVKPAAPGDPAFSTALDPGTYDSGMTYNNRRVPVAHGWDVDRGFYNGPGTKEKIHYSLNGVAGVLVLRGRGYEDGVILASSRQPGVAMCVSSFPYDLDRDVLGNWTGVVSPKVSVGAFFMAAILIGWAIGALTVLNILRGVAPKLTG